MLQSVRCVTSDVFSLVLCLIFVVWWLCNLPGTCSLQFVSRQKDFALPNVTFWIGSFRHCFHHSWFETKLCHKVLLENVFHSLETYVWTSVCETAVLVESWTQVNASNVGVKIIVCSECEEFSPTGPPLSFHFFLWLQKTFSSDQNSKLSYLMQD